jgi:hypothetical protein
MTDLVSREALGLHKVEDMVEAIKRIEPLMLNEPQVPCPVTHYFGPGICIREVKMPAGTMAIGHYQNFNHVNNFIKGKVLMLMEDGTTKTIKAPMTFTGKPGRKIGYIIEDMVWQNIYPTEETDVETVEKIFITKSDEFLASIEGKEKLKQLECVTSNDDYNLFLTEYSITEQLVRTQSENKDDQIPFPSGCYSIKVSKSNIQGSGLFATAPISKNEIIAPARITGMRTPAGRFTNHALAPNAMMIKNSNGDIDLVAVRDISGCRGGMDGEEITVNYRQVLSINREN